MVRRRDLITTTEHHGEGILEFHVTNPAKCINIWECLSIGVIFFFMIAGRLLLHLEFLEIAWWQWACWLGLAAWFTLRRMGHMRKESLLVVHDLGVQVWVQKDFACVRACVRV